MIRVSRRYRFSASHRLHQPALTEAENREVYGKCNNPFGHGHNYVLDVSVAGVPDAASGVVVDIRTLDRMVHETVVDALEHRNLNTQAPEFASGAVPPTSECLAQVIRERLSTAWPRWFPEGRPLFERLCLEETENNRFELACVHRNGNENE